MNQLLGLVSRLAHFALEAWRLLCFDHGTGAGGVTTVVGEVAFVVLMA